MQQPNLVLEIKSHLDELPRTRNFVRECCCQNIQESFGEEDICQLELAVHEAAVNIIRHAYGNRIDKRIVIEAYCLDDKLMFRLKDWGQSFDPDSVPPPVLDGTTETGLGLYIIERCVDEATYIKNETGMNTLCLIKRKRTREIYVQDTEGTKV